MNTKMQDLHKVLKENSKHIPDSYLDQVYNEYFNMNWLRPETALYYFSLAKAMYKFKDYFKEPILDLGCGDGTFLTIFFGGKFDKTIDCYRTVDLNKKDIYDNYIPPKITLVTKKPKKSIYGLDRRENVVKTARNLKVYKEIKVGDVKNIPFEDKTMETVYCNMINDIKVKDLSKVFNEINRVLKDKGFVIFTSPTDDFLDCLYYKKSIWKPKTIAFWKKFLDENGFTSVTFEPFMDEKLSRFWDTGFRPYFKRLLKLKEDSLMPIVKWMIVEILKNSFYDYVNKPLEGKIGFVLIVARKK